MFLVLLLGCLSGAVAGDLGDLPISIQEKLANETKKLTASDTGSNGQFGWEVAIGGTTIAVGVALGNSVYIFERDHGGAGNWGEVRKITGSDIAGSQEGFGRSIALDGTTLVVGAPLQSTGEVYVFERDQGGIDNWGETKMIIASDAAGGDHFGHSVAIPATR